MSDTLAFINVDKEIKNTKEWKHRLESPQCTQLEQVFGNKFTRYNKWVQSLDLEKSFNENSLKIFFNCKSTHIHAIQHATLFTDLTVESAKSFIKSISLTIHTTNNTTELFSFTFDEYISIMNLLNIKLSDFIIPFQYFIFGKLPFHSCYEHFKGFTLTLNTTKNPSLFRVRIDSICYTMSKKEVIRITTSCHEYIVNKYITLKHHSNSHISSIQLDYTQPIKSIVAYGYCTSSDLCVNINGIPFYGSYDNSPNFYGLENTSQENLFSYLKSVDNIQYMNIVANCENHMYFKALCDNNYFFDENDCYCKLFPTDKVINIESACEAKIKHINFLIQFTVQLQMDTSIAYGACINKTKIINPNSYPLTKLSNETFVEGYWQSNNECGCCNPIIYPYPVDSGVQVDPIFIQNLEHIKNFSKVECYFGSSYCRLCPQNVGGLEYSFKSDGKTFIFPEGIFHYYRDHNVQPSDEFMDAVEQYIVDEV